ncbi:MAG TPA: DUF2142 domain-containing protein [Patescibacteria group bacterium]|nr:DUF2142 domain-containing protein [Patescibacteria group bacterium]
MLSRLRLNQFFNNPVKFFIALSLIFGSLFLIITPPFQGADEVVHYYRAYQVSEGRFISEYDSKTAGGHLPESLGKIIAITNSPVIATYPQNKYNEHRTLSALKVNTNDKLKYYQFSAAASYNPVAYILSSLGMLVSRLLHLPTLLSLYVARLGNLMTWIILGSLSIYFLPYRKWVLVAIGLLPMALFEASTINGDAVTIGSLMLLFSLILNYRTKNVQLNTKHILLLGVLSIVLVLSKEIMFIFLPLILLLKKSNFKSTRQSIIIKLCLIIIPIILFLGWLYITRNINSVSIYYNHQNPSQQISYIVHQHLNYINTLWNTYFYAWGDNITRSFIGVFGWADTPLSELIVSLGYISLAFLYLVNYDRQKYELNKNEKVLLISLLLIYTIALSSALYVYYSPLHFKIVYGLQGRYYLPIAIISIILLPIQSIKTSQRLYLSVAKILPVMLLCVSLITIYVRYFIHNV